MHDYRGSHANRAIYHPLEIQKSGQRYLFVGSDTGGERAAAMYNLIWSPVSE
ncbi:MAG: hypothetical protein VB142_04525 [Burkholderia sp.]